MGRTFKGHPLPENPFEWTKDFETLYKIIDDEHKEIFDEINRVGNAPNDKEVLKKCKKVIKDHFVDEEKIMQKNDYPGYEAHKILHDAFLDGLEKVDCPVSKENCDTLKHWLCDHICQHDFRYKGKFGDPTL